MPMVNLMVQQKFAFFEANVVPNRATVEQMRLVCLRNKIIRAVTQIIKTLFGLLKLESQIEIIILFLTKSPNFRNSLRILN